MFQPYMVVFTEKERQKRFQWVDMMYCVQVPAFLMTTIKPHTHIQNSSIFIILTCLARLIGTSAWEVISQEDVHLMRSWIQSGSNSQKHLPICHRGHVWFVHRLPPQMKMGVGKVEMRAECSWHGPVLYTYMLKYIFFKIHQIFFETNKHYYNASINLVLKQKMGYQNTYYLTFQNRLKTILYNC